MAEAERDDRSGRLLVLVAGIAAVLPVLVAGVRGALRDWTPTGDDAFSAIRADDVFSRNVPLLGTWSSASSYTGHVINHPGPLHFDLLAVPVWLFGHGTGTAVGMALVNGAALGLLGWLVHRRLGTTAAVVAYALSACLAWSLGSEMLYDPWSQYAPLLPFALFVVAVWCTVAGDAVAAPIAVVAGSYALQTHLSYALLVPGLALFGAAAVVGRLVVRRRDDPDGWPALRRRARVGAGITLGVTLLCWAQPLVEELTADGEGNLTALARSVSASAPTPGLGRSIRALGGTVAVPPAWLPPSYGSPSFGLDGRGVPTPLAALGLLAFAAACAVLGWRALHRGSTAVAAGAATGLVGLVLAVLTCLRAPIRFTMAPTYFRWMWPFGMVLWLVVVVAALDEPRLRQLWSLDDHNRRRLGWAAPVGVALAVVAGLFTLPTVDNGSATVQWAIDGTHEVDDAVVDAVDGRGPVLVDLSLNVASIGIGPALLGSLQEAGVRFYVQDPVYVRQLGNRRSFDPGDARTRLRITGGLGAEPQDGEELVARYDALTKRQRAELRRLEDRVVTLVEAHGLPLDHDAARVFAELDRPQRLDEIAAAAHDPEKAVSTTTVVRDLWESGETSYAGGPLLDPKVFPHDLMDRWVELRALRDDSSLAVFVAPLDDPPAG
jgi:hypothetical protein